MRKQASGLSVIAEEHMGHNPLSAAVFLFCNRERRILKPLQVLGEPGRANTTKSYMWLARGGPPEAPVYLYRHSPTR